MGKLFGAGGLGLLSLVMLLGFFRTDASGISAVLALLVTVGLPAAGSAALIYSHLTGRNFLEARREKLRRESLEAEILKLAATKGGKLTVVEVVSATAVDSERVKAALDSLHLKNHAQIQISESGTLVYSFPEIKGISEKSGAKGVLDA